MTSILNGAFPELLDGDQRLDFTAKDDVATYTAVAALDPTTPRILRIAGDSLSVRDPA